MENVLKKPINLDLLVKMYSDGTPAEHALAKDIIRCGTQQGPKMIWDDISDEPDAYEDYTREQVKAMLLELTQEVRYGKC